MAMRKTDLAVVVAAIAVGASLLSSRPNTVVQATPTACQQRVSMAGVPMGCGEDELRSKLGPPQRVAVERDAIRHFHYDGLVVTLINGKVASMGGSGRWSLEREGPLPAFMATRPEVERVFGKPIRDSGNIIVYRLPQGELTYHFGPNGRVSQVWLSGALDRP